MADHESLFKMLERWRAGDQSAAMDIYRRYEQRLLRLADRKIGPHLRPEVDPDDIMLSVLHSVLKGIASGKYDLDPSGSLWNLVAKIADNKILKKIAHHTAAKRDIRKKVDAEMVTLAYADGEPAPEDAAVLADELERIRPRLTPESFQIFELQLQGYGCAEIAGQLGCSRHTIRRKANRIQELLRRRPK